MVFEVDRFRLVTANNVLRRGAAQGAAGVPRAVADRSAADRRPPARNGRRAQRRDVHGRVGHRRRPAADLLAALRPDPGASARALEAGRGVARSLPAQADDSSSRLTEMKVDEATARFLPVMARKPWVAVLDKTGDVLGYLPLDGFF